MVSVDVGPGEVILILVVLMLLFGAKKLPEIARGSGRALRIFKEEMRPRSYDDEWRRVHEPVAPGESGAKIVDDSQAGPDDMQ